MKLALFAIAVIGCGGNGSGSTDANGSGSTDAPTNPAQRYNPWTVGAAWSYQLTNPATNVSVMNRVTTVGPLEDVGGAHAGTQAYKVHIELTTGAKDIWEAPLGDFDVRYKTTYLDANNTATETDTMTPYRLHLDESFAHTATGAMFTETFSETDVKVGQSPTSKTETLQWSIVSDSEPITVIAGSYTALHVRRFNSVKNETIDYWYARGVGKLKESGGNSIEELMSYTPGP